MDFDDDGFDDEPAAPLLPPEDRLWRHPSEVASTSAGGTPRRNEPRLLTVVALTSSISVLLTLGIVAVVRPVRTQLAVEQVAAPAEPTRQMGDSVADVVTITERLRRAITQVSVDAPGGSRRGSAVVYRSDGLLLTAHHLVEGARRVEVTLDDGRTLEAEVKGGDRETDIAVLDVEGDRFAVAPLGSATAVKVGQPAITIGTATDGRNGPVVTVGVVSATGQAVDAHGRHLLDMLQTDAAVAPGCAGGAVVDAAGVVIGIATMNVAHEGGANGYATPIDVARLVAGQLLTHGRVTRGWLGIDGETVSRALATEVGADAGVVVKLVRANSPADNAGLRATDVIVAIDGKPVVSMAALVVELRTRRPGDAVKLTVVRNGERREVRATLGEKPASA